MTMSRSEALVNPCEAIGCDQPAAWEDVNEADARYCRRLCAYHFIFIAESARAHWQSAATAGGGR